MISDNLVSLNFSSISFEIRLKKTPQRAPAPSQAEILNKHWLPFMFALDGTVNFVRVLYLPRFRQPVSSGRPAGRPDDAGAYQTAEDLGEVRFRKPVTGARYRGF